MGIRRSESSVIAVFQSRSAEPSLGAFGTEGSRVGCCCLLLPGTSAALSTCCGSPSRGGTGGFSNSWKHTLGLQEEDAGSSPATSCPPLVACHCPVLCLAPQKPCRLLLAVLTIPWCIRRTRKDDCFSVGLSLWKAALPRTLRLTDRLR